jgi:hypothetical protein
MTMGGQFYFTIYMAMPPLLQYKDIITGILVLSKSLRCCSRAALLDYIP